MPNASQRVRVSVLAVTVAAVLSTLTGVASASTDTGTDATPTTTTTTDAPSLTVQPPHADVTKHHHARHHARHHRSRAQIRAARHEAKVHRVLKVAAHQKGKPYRYGADGPGAFDCSGLVMYVFQHAVHHALPHNAAAQYHSIRHIRKRNLEPGDLIFTDNGYISHVGIYAGHHHWWVAPHTGARVHKQRIYHAHFVYGRVLVKNHHHNHHHHR